MLGAVRCLAHLVSIALADAFVHLIEQLTHLVIDGAHRLDVVRGDPAARQPKPDAGIARTIVELGDEAVAFGNGGIEQLDLVEWTEEREAGLCAHAAHQRAQLVAGLDRAFVLLAIGERPHGFRMNQRVSVFALGRAAVYVARDAGLESDQ